MSLMGLRQAWYRALPVIDAAATAYFEGANRLLVGAVTLGTGLEAYDAYKIRVGREKRWKAYRKKYGNNEPL